MGISPLFCGVFRHHHVLSSQIKNRPVVNLSDAAGRQRRRGLSSLGNDFYRPTSFGSVARPSTMTPTATFGSLATTLTDTLERCCAPSGNNSDLTLRAPGTSARTSAFVGRGIQSPLPTLVCAVRASSRSVMPFSTESNSRIRVGLLHGPTVAASNGAIEGRQADSRVAREVVTLLDDEFEQKR
jgi:hypothetical protein